MPIFITAPERGATSAVRLGDAVAAVAKPIARAADALIGTHLSTCASCARRRLALNAAGGDDAREWPPADEAGMV